MRQSHRGSPGEFEARLIRARSYEPPPGTEGPMHLLEVTLRHQIGRAGDPAVQTAARDLALRSESNMALERFPTFDFDLILGPLLAEVALAVTTLASDPETVPEPLLEAGRYLVEENPDVRLNLVSTWVGGSQVDPLLGFWLRAAAAPILETAAHRSQSPHRETWSKGFCPFCGGLPQVSVIAEETGEFMAGSPRYLVCERCASWWAFPRACCPVCREDDSTRLETHAAEGERWVRIDSCQTCHSYAKTFDLRVPGSSDVVPLVDDVATLTLDLWAHDQGLRRPDLSSVG